MSITALPTPPQRSDPTNFAVRADAFLTALPQFATDANALQIDVSAKQVLATASQVAALASQTAAAISASSAALSTNVTVWVSGTTYAQYVVVVSPIDFQNYRRAVAGAGTTDPSADLTNWRLINYVAPWQIKTIAYTAIQGDRLMVNTTAGAVPITLPAAPVAGISQVLFKDYAATWGTNNLTILRNGNNIEGIAQDMTVSQNYRSFGMLFIDATRGWVTI